MKSASSAGLLSAILSVAGIFESSCSAFTITAGRPSTGARSAASTGDNSRLFASFRDAEIETRQHTRRDAIGVAAASSASLLLSAVMTTPAAARAASPVGGDVTLAQLLAPIAEMSDELRRVQTLVKDKNEWPAALAIMQNPKYDKPNFKKTFNAFGDNVGNVPREGGGSGGSAPKTAQSLAYLLRNDLLTNLENLAAELEYLIKNDDDVEDLYKYSNAVVAAMQKYLNIAPPGVLEDAQRQLAK